MKAHRPESPQQWLVAWVLIALSLTLVAIAERDLHGRPDEQIRGDRRIWRLVCLNAIGAVAYLTRGRRPA